jgi:hypothetical protein
MVDVSAQRNLQITGISTANDVAAKTATVAYGNAKARTPARAMFYSATNRLSESRALPSGLRSGVNEIFRSLSREKVNEIDSNLDEQRRFQNTILATGSLAQLSEELLFTVFNLEGKGADGHFQSWLPSDRETAYIVAFLTGMPSNNVVVPPAIPGASAVEYLAFLAQFFEHLPSGRSVPVAGLVPNLPFRDVHPIMDFYMKHGLTDYVVDFHGKSPITNWSLLPALATQMSRIQKEHGTPFVHGLNVKYGMKSDRTGIVPARDLFLVLECFDSFGASHCRPKFNPAIFRKGLSPDGSEPILPPRIFDAGEYGYRRVTNSANTLQGLLKNEGFPDVPRQRPSRESWEVPELAKILNAVRTGKECGVLIERITEGKVRPHLDSKPGAQADIKKVDEVSHAYRGGRSGQESFI